MQLSVVIYYTLVAFYSFDEWVLKGSLLFSKIMSLYYLIGTFHNLIVLRIAFVKLLVTGSVSYEQIP